MYGITHVYHAAMDTQVIVTNHIAGIPLRAWYVFEVQPDPSDLPMEPTGPFTEQSDAVDSALLIVGELRDLDDAIRADPFTDPKF
jgi:hypothetical protein